MRTVALLLLVLGALFHEASADGTPTHAPNATPKVAADTPRPSRPPPSRIVKALRAAPVGKGIALTVNAPTGWMRSAFGASLYVGLSESHRLRLNGAMYPGHRILLEDEASFFGDVRDVGIGWVYQPGGWSGFTFEVGGLYRRRAQRVEEEWDTFPMVATSTKKLAGHAMVGYGHVFRDRLFVAFALGASYGRERGEQSYLTSPVLPGAEPHVRAVDRVDGALETYVRIGVLLGGEP